MPITTSNYLNDVRYEMNYKVRGTISYSNRITSGKNSTWVYRYEVSNKLFFKMYAEDSVSPIVIEHKSKFYEFDNRRVFRQFFREFYYDSETNSSIPYSAVEAALIKFASKVVNYQLPTTLVDAVDSEINSVELQRKVALEKIQNANAEINKLKSRFQIENASHPLALEKRLLETRLSEINKTLRGIALNQAEQLKKLEVLKAKESSALRELDVKFDKKSVIEKVLANSSIVPSIYTRIEADNLQYRIGKGEK